MEVSRRILLVEDDQDQLAFLTAILKNKGYQVTGVDNAAQGLDILKTKQIDIIISDVAMPEINGPSFVSSLRQIDGHNKTPVILLTSGTEIVDFTKIHFKADKFLLKKGLPNTLLNEISNFA